MDISELKASIQEWKQWLAKRKGTIVSWGDGGPVTIGIIESLIAVLETQDKRIKELEETLAQGTTIDTGGGIIIEQHSGHAEPIPPHESLPRSLREPR